MTRSGFETTSGGITLRGELLMPTGGPVTVIPLCHGIPREGPPREGDPGYMPLAERLVEAGYGALVFNFRGCGISDGDFDILGWGRDLVVVTDALAAMENVERIVPWGFSGGAAASLWAAARSDRIDAVALFACPADFAALKAIPVVSGLVEYFRRVGIIRDPGFPTDEEAWLNGFVEIDPEKHAAMITPRPLLIVHGSGDETVPVDHGNRIMKAAGEPKTLRIIEGAPHRLREIPEAIDAAFEWLEGI